MEMNKRWRRKEEVRVTGYQRERETAAEVMKGRSENIKLGIRRRDGNTGLWDDPVTGALGSVGKWLDTVMVKDRWVEVSTVTSQQAPLGLSSLPGPRGRGVISARADRSLLHFILFLPLIREISVFFITFSVRRVGTDGI